jgi:predicted nucleic acid-binding protein
MSVEFCDSNVIVYAHDRSAGTKHPAQLLIARLLATDLGSLSVQVLQEVYVTLTRKLHPAFSAADARLVVDDLSKWPSVVEPTRRDVLDAINGSMRWGVSFWDALILVAANRAGASIVWTEDLNDGQRYDDVTVRNPF